MLEPTWPARVPYRTASTGLPSTEAATTPSAGRRRAPAISPPETITRGSRSSALTSRARPATSCAATSSARTRAGTSAIPNGTGVGDGVRMLNAINTTVVGNLISGNPNGVRINGAVSTGNTVQGNYIGTDVTGATAVPNTVGVLIENNAGANTIGGASAGQGNLISGNTGSGIALNQGTGVVIQGNSIGANATGSALGNGGNGIRLGSQTASEIPTFLPATNTQVGGTAAGASNLIANNGQAGVSVLAGQGNSILGNSISANGGSRDRPRRERTSPRTTPATRTSAPTVSRTSRSSLTRGATASRERSTARSNATYRLEFFSNASCDASGNGEGKTYLGTKNVTTNGSGNASFTFAAADRSRPVRDGNGNGLRQQHVGVLGLQAGRNGRAGRQRTVQYDCDR